MKMSVSGLLATAALLLSTVGSSALSYTETTDFSDALSPFESFVGTLDLGVNQISGSLNGTCVVRPWGVDCNSAGGDNQDSPTLAVASGMQIQSIEFSYNNFIGPSGIEAGLSARQHIVDFSWNNLGAVHYTSADGGFLFGDSLGLPAGLYGFSIYGIGALETGEYHLDYTLTITVSEVPIPGALLFLSSGLLLLSRFRNV